MEELHNVDDEWNGGELEDLLNEEWRTWISYSQQTYTEIEKERMNTENVSERPEWLTREDRATEISKGNGTDNLMKVYRV